MEANRIKRYVWLLQTLLRAGVTDYFKKRKALDHEIDKTLAEIQRILGIEINIEE